MRSDYHRKKYFTHRKRTMSYSSARTSFMVGVGTKTVVLS